MAEGAVRSRNFAKGHPLDLHTLEHIHASINSNPTRNANGPTGFSTARWLWYSHVYILQSSVWSRASKSFGFSAGQDLWTSFQQMRGKAVTEHVQGYFFLNASQQAGFFKHQLYAVHGVHVFFPSGNSNP